MVYWMNCYDSWHNFRLLACIEQINILKKYVKFRTFISTGFHNFEIICKKDTAIKSLYKSLQPAIKILNH